MWRPLTIHATLWVAIASATALTLDLTDPLSRIEGSTWIHETKTANENPLPRVLLVHSYHSGYPWVDSLTRGVHMALPESEVELGVFHMDTKRRSDEAWMRDAGARALKLVEEWQPSVVIATDDNAQRYFASLLDATSDVPVVFCGVNGTLEEYGYPNENATGILERPHFEESIRYLQRLYPEARRIAIVSDDSPTSRGAISHMNDIPGLCEIVSRETPATFQDWRRAILGASKHADAIAVYTYHTVLRQDTGENARPKRVMDWSAQNSTIPIVGFLSFAVDDGAICGFLESGVEQGRLAGDMARRILEGARPSDLPIVTALEGYSMLNLRTARQMGVEIPEDLLESTEVVRGE